MGLLIASGILVLLAALPLGFIVRYDGDGFRVDLVIGFSHTRLFPRVKKREKKEKDKKSNANKTPSAKKPAQSKAKTGGSITQFQDIVGDVVAFLGSFRRKLRVRNLEMKITLAVSDPCDLASNYGRTWAAVGNLIPTLERLFTIKKRNIDVACDFCADQTTVTAYLDVVISFGRLIHLTGLHGIRILRKYLKIKNLSKGGNSL